MVSSGTILIILGSACIGAFVGYVSIKFFIAYTNKKIMEKGVAILNGQTDNILNLPTGESLKLNNLVKK